ncbi:hypothetical protein AZI85_15180 [Bdellovibrio bacteriovorus]|uniref:Uncharacterized protein n=1 Tax=Bdellovibrio bacteriovorus TaxID=959 RepID=A0A150WUB9_BDEBC|nr:hypothetical protein [Bdellovibrio bacteriovorus]KYG70033.1 hypothetical protein AZI85_15180 [Bdellovibrio bacteriovorus]BFD67191.1 hypothetical protein HAGR004_22130 [Bdellovibrio sp. HAGR004]
MGDVEREVKNATNTVSNAVGGAVKAVDQAWNTGRESFERSDVGRVVSTGLRPITATVEATGDVVRGVGTGHIDRGFTMAGRRLIGAAGEVFNPVAQASNAFDFVEDGLKRDHFFSSFAESADAYRTLQRGEALTDAEKNSLVNMTVKQAAIAGAVAAAPYAASAASSAGSWVAANPMTATVAGSQVYSGLQRGNMAQVASGLAGTGMFDGIEWPNLELPQFPSLPQEWTDAFKDIQNNLNSGQPKVSAPATSPIVIPYPNSAQSSGTALSPIILIGAALGVGLIFMLKKRR